MDSQHEQSFSMNDIIFSMRGHLLDQHAHADPGFGSQNDRIISTMNCDKENVDPVMERQSGKYHQRHDFKKEMSLDESLLLNKVPPLSLGDPGEDSETEIELNTPRLNHPLFLKLKKKYPRAFRRRSSAFSDTSSVCSLSLPGTPRTPRRLSFPSQAASNYEDKPLPRSDGRQNSIPDNTLDKGDFERTIEDKGTDNYFRAERSTFDQSVEEDLRMHSNAKERIEKRFINPKHGVETRTPVVTDSKLSLKERLYKNKSSLRELLDEKYPFKNRSLSVFTSSPQKPEAFTTKANHIKKTSHPPEYCASKPPKPTHTPTTSKRLTNGNLSLHDNEHTIGADSMRQGRMPQKRLVTDHFDHKLPYSKRFSSPDSGASTHDSAVDVDSASLQSSPSSADHNHNSNQAATSTQRTSTPNISADQNVLSRPSRFAPKLKSRRNAQPTSEIDHQISYNRDSDTDSGIGAHGHYSYKRRDRNHSSSSGDTEDLNTAISEDKGDSSNNSSPRQGPVKGDHAIRTSSPIHAAYRDEDDEEVEMWYKHGARPKVFRDSARRAASVADLPRKRESPSRVHFNDDVDYSDELQPWHRTASQPDLSSSYSGLFQFGVALDNDRVEEYNDNGASHENDEDVVLHGPGRPSSVSGTDTVWDNTSQSNYSTTSGPELAHEIGYYSKLYEDINNTGKSKKSKRPWKRNKAKFTPSSDNEKVFSNLVKARSTSNIAQGNEYKYTSQNDLYENIPALRSHGSVLNDTYENLPATLDSESVEENPYEEVPNMNKKPPPTKPPRPEKSPEHGSNNHLLYAAVDKRATDNKRMMYSSNPCIVQQVDETISVEEGPPVPARGYTSDLEKYKELSGSRSSLSEKVGSMKKTAKKGLTKLRRAISLEKLDKEDSSDGSGKLRKSSSIHSLKEKLPFRRKSSDGSGGRSRPSSGKSRLPRPGSGGKMSRKHSSSTTALDVVDSPTHFRPIGKLLQLNPDGTQLLELNKPPHGPFGFYIARGNAKYNHGIFISRLSDSLPPSFFASLIGVGDEILEINQLEVRSLTMEQIHDMMASTNRLILKTLPFLARKEVT